MNDFLVVNRLKKPYKLSNRHKDQETGFFPEKDSRSAQCFEREGGVEGFTIDLIFFDFLVKSHS